MKQAVFALAAVLLLASMANFTLRAEPLPDETPIDSLIVSPFTVEYNNMLDGCRISITLPQIVDADGDPLDDTIDFAGESAVNDLIAASLGVGQEVLFDHCEPQGKHTTTYELMYNRDGWLGFLITTRISSFGEDDEMVLISALNYNYHSGREMPLSKMMTGRYQESLNILTQKALIARGYEDATPFIDDDTAFYRDGDSLVFIIEIENPPERVPVPLSALRDYMSDILPKAKEEEN